MLELVLASPKNGALYGLLLSMALVPFVLGIWFVTRATVCGCGSSAPLIWAMVTVLIAGPAGGLLAYYVAPQEMRDRFRK